MKRPITIKCNQEQFDSVKDRLYKLEEYKESIGFVGETKLLTNRFLGDENSFATFNLSFYHEDYLPVGDWNEEIFLNACGIEAERIFKGSELQYKTFHHSEWNDCSCYEYRLKPDNTLKKQELESQILELQNQLKNL